jgi:hypothetical protein
MTVEENPFRKALEEGESEASPFSRDVPNLSKESQLRTVRDLNLVEPEVLERLPVVADLTVADLNDLASEFSGVPSNNPKVAELSLEDVRDIETVFFDFKVAAGRDLARRGGMSGLASVDVSCCCCTPCCCCAATDMTESG